MFLRWATGPWTSLFWLIWLVQINGIIPNSKNVDFFRNFEAKHSQFTCPKIVLWHRNFLIFKHLIFKSSPICLTTAYANINLIQKKKKDILLLLLYKTTPNILWRQIDYTKEFSFNDQYLLRENAYICQRDGIWCMCGIIKFYIPHVCLLTTNHKTHCMNYYTLYWGIVIIKGMHSLKLRYSDN